MDSLLRYILFQLTWKIILIELGIMVACSIGIILIKLYTRWNTNRRLRIQNDLTTRIEKCLFGKEPIADFKIPANLCQFRNLIEAMEKFNQRFTDIRWIDLKNKIVKDYLLAPAARNINSHWWFKRQLVGRAYLLAPEIANEDNLRKLLNDSRYLVRVVAAVSITKISNKSLFNEMIRKMKNETSLSQFPYRDALMQADNEKFAWMEELLSNDPDPAISAICLDLLSTRYTPNLLLLAKPFLNATDRQCRILAVKAVGNVPTPEAIRILTEHLEDSDWEIRAEATIGINKLHALSAIPKLKEELNDPVWWVRLQAALALKNFGNEGKNILNEQDAVKDPRAFEISQYILSLPQ